MAHSPAQKYLQETCNGNMATTKFYYDTRSVRPDGTSLLKLAITHKGKTSLLNLGISLTPNQWDSRNGGKILNHQDKQFINSFIIRRRSTVDSIILRLSDSGELSGLNAQSIKARVLMELDPEDISCKSKFMARFKKFADTKHGRTHEIYMATVKRIYAFDVNADQLVFDDVTVGWLRRFDAFMAETSGSRNARNIHLRNIRTVFNDAIDDEITTSYPFRRFKIRPEQTRKRSMSVETLRRLFDAGNLDDWEVKYRDFFKLSFMLIGINVVDLCGLTDMSDGRINYTRAKTHKPYSIKVEPEILSLIEQYRGSGQLLNFMEGYANYRSFYMNLCNGLKSIKNKLGIKELSTYWARHTWATIAAELDIPDAVISQALGHAASNSTTEIYIRRNQRKVDEANRCVLDWVLYGKQ